MVLKTLQNETLELAKCPEVEASGFLRAQTAFKCAKQVTLESVLEHELDIGIGIAPASTSNIDSFGLGLGNLGSSGWGNRWRHPGGTAGGTLGEPGRATALPPL